MTVSDMALIQTDYISLDVGDFKPLLSRLSPTTPAGQKYQPLLMAFDGNASIGSDLITVYSQWYAQVYTSPLNLFLRSYTDPIYVCQAD